MNSDPTVFLIDEQPISRTEFDSLLSRFSPLFARHRRILIHTGAPLELCLALVLSRDLKRELYFCHSYSSDKQVQTLHDAHEIDLLLRDGWTEDRTRSTAEHEPSAAIDSGCLYVFTSGTTGEPKIARHPWSTIQHSAAYAGDRFSGCIWMMTYSPTSYAGLQVFFSAYNNSGTIYYPPSGFEPIARGMSAHNIEIVSGTPTFWRLLINSWPEDAVRPRLRQITLGGEVVDQTILDSIKSFFSPERITHIYASTEAGTAVVVSDGQAGFPQEFLDRNKEVRLRIVEGILQVKTPARMSGYVGREASVINDGWLITGDAVDIRDGRVYILGREDGMINVGGQKVLPEEVETALQSLDEIVHCRAFARPNPITGAVVGAEVVLAEGCTFDPRGIKRRLRPLLADYKIPRNLVAVSHIEATPHGKTNRQ